MTFSQLDLEEEIIGQGTMRNFEVISNRRKRKYLRVSPYPLVRRGRYRRSASSSGGPAYLTRDNTKLKVIMYLYSLGKGANQNKMLNDEKALLRGQEWARFNNTLDDMCGAGLLSKSASEDAENVTVYRLTDKGKEIATLIRDLREKKHPLLEIDAFFDLRNESVRVVS